MPSNVIATAVSADTAVSATECTYYGFTFRETSGTATATVRLYDNATTNSGTLLDTIQLAISESRSDWYGPQGIRAQNGIYAKVVSGAVEGSVRRG
jgi:hypothetical protein